MTGQESTNDEDEEDDPSVFSQPASPPEEVDSSDPEDDDQDQDLDGRMNGQAEWINPGDSIVSAGVVDPDPDIRISQQLDKNAPRPPIWLSVGNVSGQAVTFKGISQLIYNNRTS